MIATHPAAHVRVHDVGVVKPIDKSPNPNPYAVCQVKDGRCLINAMPAKEHEPYVCPICKIRDPKSGMVVPVAYSHKRTTANHCDECEGDRVAMLGIALERQGINLGWGYCSHSAEYERESHKQHRAR